MLGSLILLAINPGHGQFQPRVVLPTYVFPAPFVRFIFYSRTRRHCVFFWYYRTLDVYLLTIIVIYFPLVSNTVDNSCGSRFTHGTRQKYYNNLHAEHYQYAFR